MLSWKSCSPFARVAVTLLVLIPVLVAVAPRASAAKREPRAVRAMKAQYEKHRNLRKRFTESSRKIADFCDKQGFSEQAESIRAMAQPADLKTFRAQELSRKIAPGLPDDLTGVERQWRVEWRHLKEQQAIKLYQLAQRVLELGNVRFAYHLIHEAVRYDPDNIFVRRFLGFEQSGNEWVTPFELRMRRDRKVKTERFGWLPKAHVPRYEKGERFFHRGWVSAAKEAELRRDFKNAWVVRTEHYVIKTNYSLERGVRLSRQLEAFYRTFYETFSGFLTTADQRQSLAKGRGGRRNGTSSQFEIHYFRDKDDYVKHLEKRVAQIRITTGLYLTDTGTAYFYHVPEMDEDPTGPASRTIFHEATHQLFSETRKNLRGRTGMVGEKSHFWIIEGIACYMESFEQRGERIILGDPDYQRFRAARYRYLHDGYYIPLKRFAGMSAMEIKHSPEIRKLYSQASGLAHFFMEYEEGKYRDALVEHLSQLYSRNRKIRENPASLPKLVGVDYKSLDVEYGDYLKAQQNEVAAEGE